MHENGPFGRWLRQRRRSLDLTQDELAARVGCAPETVRKLEAGSRRASKEVAHHLADALALGVLNALRSCSWRGVLLVTIRLRIMSLRFLSSTTNPCPSWQLNCTRRNRARTWLRGHDCLRGSRRGCTGR